MLRSLIAFSALGFALSVQAGVNEQAAAVLSAAGRNTGVFCVAGGDGALAVALAQQSAASALEGQSPLVVHVLTADDASALALRGMISSNGVDDRVYVSQGALDALPYPDNFINAVVTGGTSLTTAQSNEIARVLVPGQGKALHVNAAAAVTTLVTKAVPASHGSWTHRMHGADNNPASTDTAFSLPAMIQYLETPRHNSFQGGLFIANGRRIEMTDWVYKKPDRKAICGQLLARDLFNGRVLWRKTLPTGIEADTPIAMGEGTSFYLADGQSCGLRVYDPETGADLTPITWTDPELVNQRVKWLAVEGGRLYVLIGEPKAVRTPVSYAGGGSHATRAWQSFAGTTVVCLNLADRTELWRYTEPDGATIDYRNIAVKDSNVYYFSEIGAASTNEYPITSQGKRLVCLNAAGSVALENTGNPADPNSWINRIQRPIAVFLWSTEANSGLIAGDDVIRIEMTGHYEEFFFNRSNLALIGSLIPTDSKWNSKTEIEKLNIGQFVPGGVFAEGKYLNRWGTYTINQGGITTETVAPLDKRGNGCGMFCWVPGLDSAVKTIFGMLKSPCSVSQTAAGGLLSAMTSQCDCGNGFLRGSSALASANGLLDTNLNLTASVSHPLIAGSAPVPAVSAQSGDWAQYRGGTDRKGSSGVQVALSNFTNTVVSGLLPSIAIPPALPAIDRANGFYTHGLHRWEWLDRPTPAVTGGGMAFYGDSKGAVRGIRLATRSLAWEYRTGGPVLTPPVFYNGRVYAGSGDGWLYCLDAATGQLAWRYRGAPLERRMMLFGKLTSPWPVTAVTEYQGNIFAVAGHLAHNGTVVFGLNAADGTELWTPHWVKPGYTEIIKDANQPFSNEGRMTVVNGKLWLKTNAGYPAIFDPATGQRQYISSSGAGYVAAGSALPFDKLDRIIGSEVIRLNDQVVIQGGRPLTANPDERGEKVAADYFVCFHDGNGNIIKTRTATISGIITPSVDQTHIALIGRNDAGTSYGLFTRQLSFWDLSAWQTNMEAGVFQREPADWNRAVWVNTNLDVNAAVICSNAVVVAHGTPNSIRNYVNGWGVYSNWKLSAFRKTDGAELWSVALPAEPVFNGITPADDGTLVVVLRDGQVACIGEERISADMDGDGLPDAWEIESFGHTAAGPNTPAANGINTVMECYIAGLDPADPDSMLRVAHTAGPLQSVLEWQGVSGRVYNVYWSSNLLSGFQMLQSNVPWTASAVTTGVHGAQSSGFYRIEAQLE